MPQPSPIRRCWRASSTASSILARGGRSTAVTGVAADPFTFYFGGIGGGVWKSTNAGTTWHNVSDRYFEAGSVGAIAVSDSNPLVVYAGTGTACPRVNVSPGVGACGTDRPHPDPSAQS